MKSLVNLNVSISMGFIYIVNNFCLFTSCWCVCGMKFMELKSCWRSQALVLCHISAQGGTCRYTHTQAFIQIHTHTHTHTHTYTLHHLWVCVSISSFDFSVTVFAFLGLIALAFDMEPFYFIVVLRPFQLLRYVYLFVCVLIHFGLHSLHLAVRVRVIYFKPFSFF